MKLTFYITLLSISLIAPFVSSQVLDESFLKSLPVDMADDLLEQSANKKAAEETQYRRPSTFIEKPEPTSDRFGANIFSMMQSSLMPLNEPNFDSSYILDFGDVLELQLVGQKSSTTKLLLKRDGTVNIQDIGKLSIAGLSLDKATGMIKNKISQTFIGVDAFVTLAEVRDIQIIMSGNVYNPGSYTLNGNSNIFHALSVSGGPSENGSFRSIDLIRKDKKIETVDLYDTFIFGKPSFKTRLRSGDLIFVNAVENVVSIAGAVKRPGSYEIKRDGTLADMIRFSNGVSAFADLNNIKLERVLDGRIKSLPIVNISQFDNIKAKDMDAIFIREHPFRSVTISGAVLNPGKYLMNEGDSILDVIDKSGGYTNSAYIFGAVYQNQNAMKVSEEAVQRLYENSIQNITEAIKTTGSEIDYVPLIAMLEELKESKVSGRVVVDLDSEDETTLIQDGDIILIPEITNQIYVYGSIHNNGSALYKQGQNLEYYISKKGGFTENADKNNIYMLNPNGETFQIKTKRNLFISQGKKAEIYPGSVIYVPEKVDSGYQSMIQAQAYASILGNLGVSLASLSVLKD